MDNLEMVLNAVEAFERDWYAEHPDGKDVEANWEEYQDMKRKYIKDYMRDCAEAEREMIENLEERQHQSGFYAFQDQMDLRRFER